MLMPGDMLKVIDTLFGYQKDGFITYSRKNCEFLHLDQSIVEQAIQTAIDAKLIEPVSLDGGVYKFRINKSTIDLSREIPLGDIPSKPLLRLSSEIKFKEVLKEKQPSSEELLEEIRRLKAQLMLQVKEKDDDLPW